MRDIVGFSSPKLRGQDPSDAQLFKSSRNSILLTHTAIQEASGRLVRWDLTILPLGIDFWLEMLMN
jgi:hypothetical protein